MLREADLCAAICESSRLCVLAGDRPEWREASLVKPKANTHSHVLPAAGSTVSELSCSC